MFGIGPLELVMIFVVALLVFGPKRVPELARTLGRGMAEFRRASNELRQNLALDEVQQDLRRGLTESQTIHRPTPKKPETSQGDQAGEAAATASKPAGELPLDDDHEHHDEADDPQPEPNSAADPELGNVPVTSANPADSRRG